MADITMPKMGFDMTEGTIVRWLKQVGDDVKKGEPIAEIETDKVTIEIEAFSSGKLTQIVAEEGAVVPVGNTIAVLDGEGGNDGAASGGEQAAAAGSAQSVASATGADQAATAGDQGDQAATAEAPRGDAAATQNAGEGGEAVSGAAQQTESANSTATQARSGGATQDTSVGDRPAEGYGSDVTAQEETTGQAQPSVTTADNGQTDGAHVAASPVAKRIARENNVSLGQIKGSGPGGRIVREDVEAFLKSGNQPQAQPAQAAPAAPKPAPQQPEAPKPAPQQPQAQPEPTPAPAGAPLPGTRREPLSRLRQTIARRLVQSKAPVPHFYVTSEILMDEVLKLRKQLNASGDVKITVNDMIVKASAIAMTKFPTLNASFANDALDYHDYINAGIAVATGNGLLAPAVTDVDRKSLGTISREAKELIERTRNGKATPDELGRGTYSTSNLGMYPVDSFVAIINPPQAVIIAVGAAGEQPIVRNGQIEIGNVMKATISVDHRVADGAVAAEYMQELKRLLETPMLILL